MIQTIRYSSLRTLGRTLTLCDQIYEIVFKAYPEEPFLAKAMADLKQSIEAGHLAVGSSRRETGTEEVITARGQRIDNFIGLRQTIEAASRRHSKPKIQVASKRLMDIFDQNDRTLYRLNYGEQTAAFESLFKDLDTAEARADIKTVGATEWMEELRDSHEAFKTAYAQRGKEKADSQILTDAKALEQLKPATDSLCILLNAAFINQQLENISRVVSLTNEAIDRALNLAGKGQNQEDEDAVEDPAEDEDADTDEDETEPPQDADLPEPSES